MSALTSPTKIRRFLLDHAKKTRHHKFTRVSQDTLDKIEGLTRKACTEHVKTAPSKGQTL